MDHAGRKRGIEVKTITTSQEEFAKGVVAVNAGGCDGVLMIPDARVYNRANMQALLVWSVDKKKPVWTSPLVRSSSGRESAGCPHPRELARPVTSRPDDAGWGFR